MVNAVIALLSPEHYLGPLRKWSGGVHFTHLARVDFAGESGTAFVKIFPPGTGGVIGEALGYLACEHLDTPRPPHVAVIKIPVSALTGLGAPKWISECSEHVWAWCCEQIQGKTFAQYYRFKSQQDSAYTDLLRTGSGAAIAAADEILANCDRNSGSLIRLHTGRWAVIDHGECLGSHCWPVSGPYDPGRSFLLKLTEDLMIADQRRTVQSRAIDAAHRLSEAVPLWAPLIEELMMELGLGARGSEVMPFLIERANRNWMPSRLGWLA